jgi:hypothetical protein
VSPVEWWLFGLVKRLVILTRALAFVCEWVGLWGMVDDLFCPPFSDDDGCQYP